MTKKKRKNKKSIQTIRKTNTTLTQVRKTANKPSKAKTSVHKSTATQNKPKLSKKKESAIHRLLVVLGLVNEKKKANIARKNMDLTKEHPRFPFWARLRMGKWRTTLVIDEEKSLNNKTNKVEDQFVHREATSPNDNEVRNKKYEQISPNPDKTKKDNMLLKSPRKHPKHMFEPHNKDLEMPQHLKDRYDKNNYKDKKT